MGAYGSGRKFGANCADDQLAIDVRQWRREGRLIAGARFNASWSRRGKEVGNMGVTTESGLVRLSYSWQKNSGESGRLDYPVSLQTTSCHYGGVRYWFTCPAVGCGKRVAKLYLGDTYFACRHCYRLAYSSQRETKGDRGYRGAGKVRKKLGWIPGIANPPGGKPKGMHWRTYSRLVAKHLAYSNDAYIEMMATMKRVDSRFAEIELRLST
jgi:hypothetical protein